ncbi:AraC family transcriptional regulator [Actinorhabdospora filicis]|uniref:AraC family transcriptional regulator n=1 Tax=Actinorhabdospora filicis TaxID=1785913 RepID=A0A9W6W8I7_9ACTN|nr:helix-turn-helix domain-containing protein [Actinorhabdospora filicis]GLZ77018.1 AraC family transcriptional regulator [Actinorhabdospora filicis]
MSPHRIVALLHPPQQPFELAIVSQIFAAPHYSFEACSLSPGPLRTTAGYDIDVPAGLAAFERADTIVLPGWSGGPAPAPLLDALRAAHTRGARVVSICTAAFVLAEAGLLDGRAATTHWRRAAELAERFPLVSVDPDVLYVDDGDVATSAGTAAGIDLCFHLLRRDHGAAHASEIARDMVMPPHREGGQSQYARPLAERRELSLSPVLDWAVARLDAPLTVTSLAEHARMSPRTFARRFTAEVGASPGQWLLDRRVDAARELLETGDLPVEAIATRVGLSSAVNLRRHFRARLGTTPAGYRRAFRRG